MPRQLYTRQYRDQVFQSWFSLGCPVIHRFRQSWRDPETGRQLSDAILRKWFVEDDWEGHATQLREEQVRRAEEELIQNRLEAIRRHTQISRLLQSKAVAFFANNDIVSDGTALGAVRLGIELERQALGMPELVMAIQKMSDDQLVAFVSEQRAKLEGKSSEGFEEGVVRPMEE